MLRYRQETIVEPPLPVVVLEQRLGEVPLHWHDFYELVLVLDGRSLHHCNGVAYPVGPGASMLLGPTDFHAFSPLSDGPLVCYDLVIDPRAAERHLVAPLRTAVETGWFIEESTSRADIERLGREIRDQRLGAGQVVDALLACILVDFARQVRPAGTNRASVADPVRAALAYLERHFREPVTLGQVAAEVHLSPNYLSERFHASTGVSFQSHLMQRRLQFARSLLGSEEVSVTEAALAAGFGSASHLARAFRARYGRSPSEDRARPTGRAGDRPLVT